MTNPLIQKYGKEKIWVSWKLVERDGRMTKIPLTDIGTPASSTDPMSWSTYEDIKSKHENVGIVFTGEKKLLGIDIDKCINNNQIEHEQKNQIEQFIKEANTYCEVSPSKTGLHLFLSISGDSVPVLKGNRHSPYEVYSNGRYFTVTGESYGEETPVHEVSFQEAEELLNIIGYPWGKVAKELGKDVVEVIPSKEVSHDVLNKMFASKNGKQIESLYNGDTSKFNGDESLADASLLSHLAFWTGKNAFQMEMLWLSSPLGSRSKTQKRKDYRDRSIQNAISKCREVYTPPAPKVINGSDIEFLVSTKFSTEGVITTPMLITENIHRVLRHDPKYKGMFRYDEFTSRMEVLDKGEWRGQEIADSIKFQTQISVDYPEFSRIGKEMVTDAIIMISKENSFDSAKEYIKSCIWDKTPRLDYWLSKTYGVDDNLYHRAVGSNWIKGLVKRIIDPGCKFDYILVLEGEQGTKKSTSLSVLGGQWHVETTMSTESKDFFMQFQGKSIIEFSEGETLNRTEVKRMKAIITTQYDKYRPPYERLSQDFPRRCVFAMTTNETEYLKDETGNRRWLPVTLVKSEADTEWLANNRDQLFAEAYYRLYTLKETTHDFPREETLAQQANRRIQDPNTEAVMDWYLTSLTDSQREEGVTTNMAYEKVIKGSSGKNIDRLQELIIGGIFRESLKLKRKRVMKKGIQLYRWFQEQNAELKAVDELDQFNETL